MKRQSDADYLRFSLERSYQMRDIVLELRAEKATSIQDKIAYADVLQSIERFIAYYRRELSLLARQGGLGHRIQVSRVA